MILQDFISVWQAQPFRAFRIHTTRATFPVDYPLGVTLSPQTRVLVVADNTRVEQLDLGDVTRCEVFGQPVTAAEALGAIAPETLARNAQLLSNALNAAIPPPSNPVKSEPAFDPGAVTFTGKRGPKGVFVVHATVHSRDGRPLFATTGTRWNLHGVEKFENGTSLYLHHLDHPAVEQRVIIWPPDLGTFETFAEGMPLAALARELERRDARLAARPARELRPPAAYFREIRPAYRKIERRGRTEIVNGKEVELDFERYELRLVPRETAEGRTVQCPCLVDTPAEDFLFNLTDTDWDATFKLGERRFALSLRYAGRGRQVLKLILDPDHLAVRLADDERKLLPLGFVERHLRNYALYEPWDVLMAALRAGPVKARQPDVVIPLPKGYRVEMWGGDTRFPLPFLQPRFLDPRGRTLLDFRATAWAAVIKAHKSKPRVTLSLVSDEEKKRLAPARFDLELGLDTQRVTAAGLKGSTTLGMLQAMVRHVRGMKWLAEDLSAWFAKGRPLPLP